MNPKVKAATALVKFFLKKDDQVSPAMAALILTFINEEMVAEVASFISKHEDLQKGVKDLDVDVFSKIDLIPYEKLPPQYVSYAKDLSKRLMLKTKTLTDVQLCNVWTRIDIIIDDEPFWQQFKSSEEWSRRRMKLKDLALQ